MQPTMDGALRLQEKIKEVEKSCIMRPQQQQVLSVSPVGINLHASGGANQGDNEGRKPILVGLLAWEPGANQGDDLMTSS